VYDEVRRYEPEEGVPPSSQQLKAEIFWEHLGEDAGDPSGRLFVRIECSYHLSHWEIRWHEAETPIVLSVTPAY
jgi:hypothetical protein